MNVPEGVIIADAWVVAGTQETQRQHAVTVTVDEYGNEWATFHCGAGGASKHGPKRPKGAPFQRRLDTLHVVYRDEQVPDRPVCGQGWCHARHRDWIEHSEVHRAKREAQAAEIARQMPLTREALVKLERRLARL